MLPDPLSDEFMAEDALQNHHLGRIWSTLTVASQMMRNNHSSTLVHEWNEKYSTKIASSPAKMWIDSLGLLPKGFSDQLGQDDETVDAVLHELGHMMKKHSNLPEPIQTYREAIINMAWVFCLFTTKVLAHDSLVSIATGELDEDEDGKKWIAAREHAWNSLVKDIK